MELVFSAIKIIVQALFVFWLATYCTARLFAISDRRVLGQSDQDVPSREGPAPFGWPELLFVQVAIFFMSPAMVWQDCRERWDDWRFDHHLKHRRS